MGVKGFGVEVGVALWARARRRVAVKVSLVVVGFTIATRVWPTLRSFKAVVFEELENFVSDDVLRTRVAEGVSRVIWGKETLVMVPDTA